MTTRTLAGMILTVLIAGQAEPLGYTLRTVPT